MAAEAPSTRMPARSQEFLGPRKRPGTDHACMCLTYACRSWPGAYSIRPRCQLECPLDSACPSDTRAAVPTGPKTMLPAWIWTT
jgi:hypothetical protein